MGFRNPIVVADQISSGNFAGNYTIGGSFIVGNPAASHVVVGTDTHGADGVRLYGNDGVTPLIDLNIASTPTITGALIRTAATGQRVELSTTAASLISFYSGDASEVAPGTIGSQVIGSTLYTNLSGPKKGTITPPQLQMWNDGTNSSAQLNGGASGQAALMSKGWTLTFDGSYTGSFPTAHPSLVARFCVIVLGQQSSSPYVFFQLTDSANVERAFIGLCPVDSVWYSAARTNDLVIGGESNGVLIAAGNGGTVRYDGTHLTINNGNLRLYGGASVANGGAELDQRLYLPAVGGPGGISFGGTLYCESGTGNLRFVTPGGNNRVVASGP